MDTAAAQRLVALVDAVPRALANFEGTTVTEERHRTLALRLLSAPGGPLASEPDKRKFDARGWIG